MRESDWKYLQSIRPSLLEELSARGNTAIRAILERQDLSENEKRREVYDAVKAHDAIVANCFDDWRRSRFLEKLSFLNAHQLLGPEHFEKFSEEVQQIIMSWS